MGELRSLASLGLYYIASKSAIDVKNDTGNTDARKLNDVGEDMIVRG